MAQTQRSHLLVSRWLPDVKNILFRNYAFFFPFGAEAGALAGAADGAVTSPLIVKITVAFSALLVTVIVFVNAPGRPDVL